MVFNQEFIPGARPTPRQDSQPSLSSGQISVPFPSAPCQELYACVSVLRIYTAYLRGESMTFSSPFLFLRLKYST